jgi:glycerol kinase
MSDDILLVIDQGSHSSRAMVYGPELQLLAQAQAPVATQRRPGAMVEHDPHSLLDSVREVIDQAVRIAGCRPSRAGLATQRSSIACWDRDSGEPLSAIISWQDTRARSQLEPLLDAPERVRRITGLRCSPHYGASKLRWCLDHQASVAPAARQGRLAMGPLSSFLCFQLCRERPVLVDPCNAARTLLFDIHYKDWSQQLIDAMGLKRDWLPACVPNRHGYGSIATALGDVPLMVVTGDQSAVPFATGAVSEARAWIQLGTGAFIQRPLSPSGVASRRLLESLIWWDGERDIYTVEGTVNGAAAALESLHGESPAESIERAGREIGRRDIPLFLNGVGGLGSPDWRPEFESRFVGPDRGRPTAVLESIVFLLRRNLERMGPGLESLVVGGGLARSTPLCQAIADLNALPVLRLEQTETTARGTAVLLTADSRPCDQPAMTVLRPNAAPELTQRFLEWTNAMPALPRENRDGQKPR